MRIIINDYAGHPFQVELSRELARRNHAVLHLFCDSVEGAKGRLATEPDDADSLDIKGIDLGHQVRKYSYLKRRLDEQAYGRLVNQEIASFRPDVVVSANTPLEAQKLIQQHCDRQGIAVIYWLQDMLGVATHKLLRRRIPLVGEVIGQYYMRLERFLLRRARFVIAISEGFLETIAGAGVDQSKVAVIHNWAPIEELPEMPKDNDFSRSLELHNKFVFLYSGTLGLKHNPERLAQLAHHLPEADVVVVSEGLGAEWLSAEKAKQGLVNLHILPFEPYEKLPQVLASGDVLVTLLEEDAGVFSVPSKILSNMCAARAALCAMPCKNLGATLVEETGCGIVAEAADSKRFLEGATSLFKDQAKRASMGRNARRFAEKTFRIGAIADKFEMCFADAIRNEASSAQ